MSTWKSPNHMSTYFLWIFQVHLMLMLMWITCNAHVSNTFNTIQPHLLSEKLLVMNTNPSLITWIQSFMTQRPQRVRVGDLIEWYGTNFLELDV